MNTTQRILAYLFVCLPIRSIPIITLFMTNKFNVPISILYLIMGVGFLHRATTYTETQKGFTGGKVWWQNLRLLHGIVYLLVSYLIYQNKIDVVRCLLIVDLLVGFLGFLHNYLC